MGVQLGGWFSDAFGEGLPDPGVDRVFELPHWVITPTQIRDPSSLILALYANSLLRTSLQQYTSHYAITLIRHTQITVK